MILVPRKSENHWQNVRVLLVYIWRFASDCCKFSNFSLCWTGCKFTAYARVMYYMSTHRLSTMDSKIDLFALLLLVLSLSGKIKTCYFYLLENCVWKSLLNSCVQRAVDAQGVPGGIFSSDEGFDRSFCGYQNRHGSSPLSSLHVQTEREGEKVSFCVRKASDV